MKRIPARPTATYLLQSALLGVTYFGVSRWTLAHVFEVSGLVVVPIWPAGGLAVAALASGGYRLALGVALGAVLNGHADLGFSACAEAVAGAFLLRRLLRPRRWLSRPRDLPALGLAAALSAVIGATFGVAAMTFSGSVPWSEYATRWLQFWLGDFLGIAIVAPSLLIAFSWRGRLPRLRQLAGSCGIGAAVLVLSQVVFEGWVSSQTAVSLLGAFFPLVLWLVFREGRLGAAAGTLIIARAALAGSAHGHGPFSDGASQHDLFYLWVFLAVTTLGAFLLAAILEERDRIHRDLVERDSTLRAFYESAPASMGILEMRDDDLRFVSCNRTASEFFGRSPAELASTFLSEYRTAEQVREWVAPCREAASTGEVRRFELTRETESGKRTFLGVVGPVATEAVGAPRLTFAVQDVTEYRRAEMERDRFFEQGLDILCITGFDGRLQRANPAMCRALGYTEEDILHVPLEAYIHPEDLAATKSAFERMARGTEVVSFENRVRSNNGDYFWALWTGMPDLDHRVVYGVAKDISEQKRVVEALQVAKESADAATRAKSQFLANVTHELRTPLSGMMGMAGLLRTTPLNGTQREYVDAIARSGSSLLALVNDLLDFSKLEAQKARLELEPFSLRRFLAHAVRPMAPQAHQKNLELAYRVVPSVPDALSGDAGKLQQILLNLVANAIKFTESGHVVIRVSPDEEGAEGDPSVILHFEVSDTGIGISPSNQPEIFKAFVQADGSTTRRFGGTGLGLTISAEIVDLMGGRIWVESEPGNGSTFHFTARLWLQDEAARNFQEIVPPVLQGRRVLVVDDAAVVRETLDAQLRDWGMEPFSVVDGRAALDALEGAEREKRPFDLLLLDETSDADLRSFLEKARHGLHARLPGILMSPAVKASPLATQHAHGIALSLDKPVQPSHLRKAMALIFEGHVLESERQVETGTFDRPPHARPFRVLVAEDDAVNREVVVRILESAGHEVRAVESGRQALDAHERESFDAILMDVQMLELDGIDTARAIRSREQSTKQHVPIVALTAQLREEERARCVEAGMDEFMIKPVDPDRLCDLLDRVAGVSADGTEVSEPLREGAPPLDRGALLRRVEGNLGLAADLARMFLEDRPKIMKELDEKVLARDADDARRLLHRLAGSLETLGARPAGSAARGLSDATHGDDADWEPPLGRLHREIERLEGELLKLTKEKALP